MVSSRCVLQSWWLPLLAVVLAACAKTTDDPAAVQQIRDVLMQRFDRPEARLAVEPVVVAGDDAVASWAQGERGGRALMRRTDGSWRIVLCSGDALRDAVKLAEMGVPADAASMIAERLTTAEAALPPQQAARFSTFDGVVRMNADGTHPDAGDAATGDGHDHDHQAEHH